MSDNILTLYNVDNFIKRFSPCVLLKFLNKENMILIRVSARALGGLKFSRVCLPLAKLVHFCYTLCVYCTVTYNKSEFVVGTLCRLLQKALSSLNTYSPMYKVQTILGSCEQIMDTERRLDLFCLSL